MLFFHHPKSAGARQKRLLVSESFSWLRYPCPAKTEGYQRQTGKKHEKKRFYVTKAPREIGQNNVNLLSTRRNISLVVPLRSAPKTPNHHGPDKMEGQGTRRFNMRVSTYLQKITKNIHVWLVGLPTPLKNMTSSVRMMNFPMYGK